jgi:hypothetical protein
MYYSEHERNPEKYSSIPATMYTAILMVTGVDVPVEERKLLYYNSNEV